MAVEDGSQLGAEQEGAGELTVQGVAVWGRRGEPM